MNLTIKEIEDHKQGCEALGGYGHGVGPCSCGASDQPTPLTDRQVVQHAVAGVWQEYTHADFARRLERVARMMADGLVKASVTFHDFAMVYRAFGKPEMMEASEIARDAANEVLAAWRELNK